MERITLTDGSGRWFDKDKARVWYASAVLADDGTPISTATKKSWEHETLYLTSAGETYFFVMHFLDDHNPSLASYVELDHDKATKWLLANGYQGDLERLGFDKLVHDAEI